MNLPELIAALSNPAAYPPGCGTVTVIQTHISVVFLTDAWVYKIKKPVNFGFLNYETLAARKHFCQEETRLNRRLAPSIYVGTVPISEDASGLHVEGTGTPVEWAVKMRRLPDSATLEQRLSRGDLTEAELTGLARRLAEFHRLAESSPRIAEYARFSTVAGNARENFQQSQAQVDQIVPRPLFERLSALSEAWLGELEPQIEDRAHQGIPRDTHGDLRLEHIYYFPDASPPEDWIIIDCIEFHERFRYADPLADLAFLMMDLDSRGRFDLAEFLKAEYFKAAGEANCDRLLTFYIAYRAIVRAKVEGLTAAESEIPEAFRSESRQRAGRHWRLALSLLEVPDRRPGLLLIGGLPGTGKSTLARSLAEIAGFEVIRSDVVRKELAAQTPGIDLYTSEFTQKTFAECERRARILLEQGKRVIVDATFPSEARRERFFQLARDCGVPGLMLLCEADPEVIQTRLAQRVNDASDADWAIYLKIRDAWQPPSPAQLRWIHRLNSNDARAALHSAQQLLRTAGLLSA